MSVLNELAQYLESNGVGTLGVDLFMNGLIDGESINPDETQVAIKATGGIPSSTHQPRKSYTFQVLVRDGDRETAEAKANVIRDLIHTDDLTVNVDVELTSGGTIMMRGVAIQEPYVMGLDENERFIVVNNYELMTREQ